MPRIPIPPREFLARPVGLWDEQWLLLTCGDFARRDFNTMTVSWGSIGTIWDRPFAQVVVRPTRHTFTFLARYDHFTLCAFPERYRGALQLLGTKSGRDGDKIAESGLSPVAACEVPSPAFEEAELVIECRTLYWQDLDPSHFLDPAIEGFYPVRDYHRALFGRIVALSGEPRFLGP